MRCCICIWAFSEEGVGTCKDRMEIRYGLVGIQQEECLLEIYNPTQDREACSPPTFPLIFIFLLHHQGIKEITLQDPSKRLSLVITPSQCSHCHQHREKQGLSHLPMHGGSRMEVSSFSPCT